jgi:hemerythrin
MFEWNDIYSVGIPIIDEEHKKLVGLINKANLVAKFSNNPARDGKDINMQDVR